METESESHLNNETGAALLIVLIIGFLVASLMMATFMSTKNSASTVSLRRRTVSAFQIAEAGKEHAISQIRIGSFTPVAGIANIIFPGETFGSGSYAVTYDANPSVDTLLIHSLGIMRGKKALIDVVCVLNPVITKINPVINAAVTTRAPTTVTGNITVDGRDWNAAGTSIVGIGVFGIKSSSTVSVDGSAQVGGRGLPPVNNPSTNRIDLCGSDECPTSPEEVLGLPPGALNKLKTATQPSFPFHGIYYYSGTSIIKPHFNGSSGIFIVHNCSNSGQIKNVKGTFTGLIIADQVVHINANAKIVGAVVTLSTSAGGNAFGNGNANVLYSSEVINNLIDSHSFATDTTYKVVSWKQVD